MFWISTGRDLIEIPLDDLLTESKCQISGWDGVTQASETEQVLWWHNKAEDYYARLQTKSFSVDLEQIARSVGFGQPLPLAFICKEGVPWDVWYPQQIPEGYSLQDVTIGQSVVLLDYSGEDGSHGEEVVMLSVFLTRSAHTLAKANYFDFCSHWWGLLLNEIVLRNLFDCDIVRLT